MQPLPTQDDIDCLIRDGIDPRRLPVAGNSPIRKAAPIQAAMVEPKEPARPPKAQGSQIPSKPRRVSSPRPAARSSSAPFPVQIVVLVVILIILLALVGK